MYEIFRVLTNRDLLSPIIDIARLSNVAKKIDIIDIEIVYPNPDRRKFKLDEPILLNGEMAYQPQL